MAEKTRHRSTAEAEFAQILSSEQFDVGEQARRDIDNANPAPRLSRPLPYNLAGKLPNASQQNAYPRARLRSDFLVFHILETARALHRLEILNHTVSATADPLLLVERVGLYHPLSFYSRTVLALPRDLCFILKI